MKPKYYLCPNCGEEIIDHRNSTRLMCDCGYSGSLENFTDMQKFDEGLKKIKQGLCPQCGKKFNDNCSYCKTYRTQHNEK